MRVLILPVYNEEAVVEELILEFFSAHPSLRILVIDDKSQDETPNILKSIVDSRLTVIRNEVNLGHGLSVMKGLNQALNMGADFIVAADGDGNYFVDDVLNLLIVLENSDFHVVEGIRVCREDPWFRRIASFTTRQLVRLRSRHQSRDANTPFHAFRANSLFEIMQLIPETGKTIPNMYISSIIREKSFNYTSMDVMSNPRKGNNPLGVTWNQKNRNVPSARYIQFCAQALLDWFLKR